MTYAKEIDGGLYSISIDGLAEDQEIVFLPDAVPPLTGGPVPGSIMYGWVRNVLPAPSRHDIYIVRFYHDNGDACGEYTFRLLAYVDRYARVFGTSAPLKVPPARFPALDFAAYRKSGAPNGGLERGCVRVYGKRGSTLVYASYRRENGLYSLYDSWYDFGEQCNGVSLNEALARAYLALVFRPRKMKRTLPSQGLAGFDALLRGNDAVRALRRVSRFMASVEEDEALSAPAPARFLFRWLHEAGLARAWRITDSCGGSGVALSRTEYSDQYCLFMDDDSPLDERTVWKLEAALNRYDMMVRGLGPRARLASMGECHEADLRLRRTFPLQTAGEVAPEADRQSEWDVRVGIARALEEVLTPYRFAASFRVDVEAGIVAFELLVPDADMMPKTVWRIGRDGERWIEQGPSYQEDAALSYAQRLGLTLAGIAARQSEKIHTVTITAEWFYEAEQEQLEEFLSVDRRNHSHGVHDGAPFVPARPVGASPEAVQETVSPLLGEVVSSDDFKTICDALGATYQLPGGTSDQRRVALHDPRADHAFNVIIDCDALRVPGIYKAAVANPSPYFLGLSRLNEAYEKADIPLHALEDPDPFWMVTAKEEYASRFALPDIAPHAYAQDTSYALGCQTSAGLAINYNAPQRNIAEQVAKTLGGLGSVSEGIAALRRVQSESNDPDVLQACTRLMTKLTQGELRMGDQNQVVEAFLGEDRFAETLRALRMATLTDEESADGALDELVKLVDETMTAGVFADDEDTVYRVFDSSTSRILYNLAQNGMLRIRGLTERAILDNGKAVALAPDSYYHCCVELVRRLEQRFDRSDDALRYGRECVRLAPTVPLGYRQLARAYMLVGDVVRARDLLVCALRFAVGRNEIAWLYYQLAYVEWKSGNVFAAQACYLKAIVENPSIIEAAASELRELMGTEQTGIMSARDVEPTLMAVGIPLAPTAEVMDVLQNASRAAVNEGAFLTARNILSAQLHHRPDNALIHVLRSLER